jgi:hypothetical protein
MFLVAVAKIDNSGKRYAIVYDPNYPLQFIIYPENSMSKESGSIGAKTMYVTGNGFLYTVGHTDRLNERRKWLFKNDTITEIIQPYKYVGLKTKTLQPLVLYETKDLKNVVASVPKGYNTEVLLSTNVGNEDIYLVKTEFGLVGWTRIHVTPRPNIPVDVEGMYYQN